MNHNHLDKFPKVIEFENLDQTKSLKAAKVALSGLVGVYAIICNVTGALYIGSSINIGNRLVDHLVDNDTNDHLQNALLLRSMIWKTSLLQ
jgi:predicted GIY-YIG superfamily endonuclease